MRRRVARRDCRRSNTRTAQRIVDDTGHAAGLGVAAKQSGRCQRIIDDGADARVDGTRASVDGLVVDAREQAFDEFQDMALQKWGKEESTQFAALHHPPHYCQSGVITR